MPAAADTADHVERHHLVADEPAVHATGAVVLAAASHPGADARPQDDDPGQ